MNGKAKWLAAVAALVVLFVLGCPQQPPVEGSIQRDPTDMDLEQADAEWLVKSARTLLEKGPKAKLPVPTPGVEGLCGREVWISVHRGGAPDYVTEIGLADCVVDGLRNAAAKVRASSVYKNFYEDKLSQSRVKVDILKKKRSLRATQMKRLHRLWEAGWWGQIITTGEKTFYLLPDTVVFRGWGLNPKYRDSDKKGRRKTRDVVKRQVKELSRMTGLTPEQVKKEELGRFTTESYIEETPGKGALKLTRGNVLTPREFTRQQVIDAAVKMSDQLIRHQEEDGSYGYWYMTDGDEFSGSYGAPRHGGTVWGMLRIYRETGDKRFLESAKSGMKWLLDRTVVPEGLPDLARVVDRKRTNMFTQGLATLAILDMPDEELAEEHKKLYEQYGNTLLFMTNDDGQIYYNFRQAMDKKLPAKQPVYAPGEAALALLHLYKKDGQEKWLKAAKAICDYQIGEFKKSGKPDNWIIQDLSILYQLTKEEKYKEYCYKMADFNVEAQWKPNETRGIDERPMYDYIGGFSNSTPPRSTPAGSRSEAMVLAYELAKFADDKNEMKKYGDAIWQAMWFMMNHQYRPDNTFFLLNPEAAMGGVKGGLIDNNIRIDYNQHVVMAMLNGLQVFDDRPGVSTLTVFER